MQSKSVTLLKKISKIFKKVFLYSLLSLLLVMAIIVLLYWQTNIVSRAVEKYINYTLADSSNIQYGEVRGDLFNNVSLDWLNLNFKDKAKIRLKDISLNYDLWALWSGQIKISSIQIDSLSIELKQAEKQKQAAKEFNIDTLFANIQDSHFLDSLIAKMPDIELDNLEIKTAYVEIVNKNLTFDNVNFQLALFFKTDRFKIDLYKTTGIWRQKNFPIEKFQFQIIGTKDQLTLNKFQFESGQTHLALSADIELQDFSTILYIDEFYVDTDLLRTFIPAFSDQGFLQGKISLIGKPRDFAVDVKLNGTWQGQALSNLRLVSAYEYGNIKIDTLSVETKGGGLFLSGLVNPSKSAKGFFKVENLNANYFRSDLKKSNINGNIIFNFPVGAFDINKPAKSLKNMTGVGELNIYNSYYSDYNLDSLRFALKTLKGNIEVIQPSFIKIANQARFNLNGSLSRDRKLDFSVQTERGNLNNLTTALGVDSIYGTFHSNFRAFGDFSDPQLKGEFWISNFEYDEVLLDSINLSLDLYNLVSNAQGNGKFIIDKGSVYEIPVSDVILIADKKDNIIKVSNAKINSEENYIETTLSILLNSDLTQIDVDHLRLEYAKYWLENSQSIAIIIDDKAVNLENLNLSGPGNSLLNANGIYDLTDNDADVNMDLRSLNLEPFQQFLGDKHQTGGIVSGTAALKRILSNPSISVDLKGSDIRYNDVSFGNFIANFDYDSSKVFIRDLNLDSDQSSLSVEGNLGIQFDKKASQILDLIRQTKTSLKVNWENIDLATYDPLFNLEHKLTGTLDGYLEIEGTIDDPYMRQSLTMKGFNYNEFNIDSLIMFGQYSSGYLILDSLSTIFNKTSLNARGWQQFDLNLSTTDSVFSDNPFELHLNSKDNIISFIGLFNEQIEKIKGDYDLELTIAGTPAEPTISSGSMKMENGQILLSRVKDPIKNVNADISIEDNILTFNEVTAKSEKEQDWFEKSYALISKLWTWMLPEQKERGTLAIEGSVDLHYLLRPKMDMTVKANEFFADYFVESTKILLTTNNLKISGRDTINLSGRLTIPNGEYEVNLNQMQKNMYLKKTSAEISKPYLAMNLEIEIPGNFIVTSSALDLQNNFKISMLGNLRATQEAGSENLLLLGSLETESGKFTSFNQSFDIASGTVDFSNPSRINPDLNITARKQLRGKVFELVITGNLESISQNIVVRDENSGEELNLSAQDKIAFLTLGADISMVAANTDSALYGVGEDVATNTILTAAERGVEELTGFDKVEINSSDKLLDLQKLKLNNGLKQASISFGKYLTSDLYIEYRTQFGEGVPTPKLSWDAGNKITLQYRINRDWSLESNYEKTIPLGNNKIQLGLNWEYSF